MNRRPLLSSSTRPSRLSVARPQSVYDNAPPQIMVVSTSGSVAKSTIAPESFVQQAEKFSSTLGTVAMAGMNVDDDFFVHIADDGVVRSWASNGTVIDAVRLTNRQLLEQVANAPLHLKPYVPHLEKVYANVNGYDVPEDELYHPTRMNTPRAFGGPTANERVSSKLDAEAKKAWDDLNITTAEETVEAFKAAQSANPADILRRQSQNPRQCLGRICTRSSACRFLGCAVCFDWDFIVFPNMVCAGPIIPPTVDGRK
ncbi:Lactobacillus up-regulated protein [Pseudocercospora fuligena]|uniref:Lactobacillus up-regulated protein n=1 Tax=Pseudocercospora fuligena TaxID=685502 RepID=A0A8H6VMH9_9PEZI|nr:Lactobacillus up-regulated protein [Pseudocercospora fuligena]